MSSYINNKLLNYRKNDFATHQPFLWHYLKKTTKPILELGSGNGSTYILHCYSKKHNIPLVTIDHDESWLSRYYPLRSDLHSMIHVNVENGWEAFLRAIPDKEWGVVFIDQGSWQSRADAARLLKDKADYILIHDFDAVVRLCGLGKIVREIGEGEKEGEFDMTSEFSYSLAAWPEEHPWPYITGPPTLIASNKYSDLTLPRKNELDEEFLEYLEYLPEIQ